MRKFDEYTEQKKIKALFMALAMAVTSTDEKLKEQTDFYAFAATFGKVHGLRKEDFYMIKHGTIAELMEKALSLP